MLHLRECILECGYAAGFQMKEAAALTDGKRPTTATAVVGLCIKE